MHIDWTHFSPWSSLAGGILLGLAVAIFVLFRGRLLGISSILGGLIPPRRDDSGWRLAFLAGLLAAPVVASLFTTTATPRIESGTTVLLLAGLLVGWGTRHGSGCTSGHGVCGVARLSPRSLAATATFMASGFVTVYIVRHLLA